MFALLPVAALALAQLFDFVSFLAMVGRHGFGAELNPLVVSVGTEFDLRGLAILKLAMLAYVALTVGLLARRRPRVAKVVLTVGIVAGAVGGLSNLATI
ncbi:MAG: hypothetical protein M3301_06645 [Chloroflexota bacterium]|nr:hypothetical protein [Chloroflexota bacterium]